MNLPLRVLGCSWACTASAVLKTNAVNARANTILFFLIPILLFQENLAQIGPVNSGMADRAVSGVGIETAVKRWGHAVAAKTQVGYALMGQHVLVRGSVDLVTSCASLDP